jgi:tRNA(His) 5'-end guanylyltransferase
MKGPPALPITWLISLHHLHSKILTLVLSLFTSAYVYYWRDFFPDLPLAYPPVFDGRLVAYPGVTEVKDYFRWRGVDSGFFRASLKVPFQTDYNWVHL